MTTIDLVQHANAAVELAMQGVSRLTPEVLALEGMSGTMTRHLYNNLCNLPGCRYLEVGCWKGSSTVAALYGNDATGTAIDNWSQFDGPKDHFHRTVDSLLPPGQLHFIDADCWQALDGELPGGPFLVYMYDGGHSFDDHRRAITHAAKHLERRCVVVIDDWNVPHIREGTQAGLVDVGATVLGRREMFTDRNGDERGFWNGAAVFVLDLPPLVSEPDNTLSDNTLESE